MKRYISVYLTVLLSLLPTLPVLAAGAKASGPFTITQTAHVLYTRGDYKDKQLVVYFEPFKLEQSGVLAQQLQQFSYSEKNVFDNKGGHALYLPPQAGQEVKVTFTYQIREDKKQNESESSLRVMEIISCEKIEFVGERIKWINYATLQRNTLIGSVLTASNGKMSVFVEGGLVYYPRGKNGEDEFIVHGQMTFEINSKTKIYDKKGSLTTASGIKPFQRVEIKVDGGEWQETVPPRFAVGSCVSVNMLEYGEKEVSNSDVETRKITVVVKEQRKSGDRVTELLVIPFYLYDSYEYPTAILSAKPDMDLSEYKPGTVLTASYLAVNRKATPAVFSYVTDIVRDENRRFTQQELSSGIYGKPDDVVLTVTPNVLKPTNHDIPVIWKNNSSSDISFSREDYQLEIKKNGDWVKYENSDYDAYRDATSLGHADAKWDTLDSFPLDIHTDVLPNGTYRIVTSFKPILRNGELGKSYMITSTEFTVKE